MFKTTGLIQALILLYSFNSSKSLGVTPQPSEYDRQVILSLGDLSTYPDDFKGIIRSSKLKGVETQIFNLADRSLLDTQEKRKVYYEYMSKMTSHSRIYIFGHGSSGSKTITSDPIKGIITQFNAQEIAEMIKRDAPHLNEGGGNLKISTLVCDAGINQKPFGLPAEGFASRLSQELDSRGIRATVSGRMGSVSRYSIVAPFKLVQDPKTLTWSQGKDGAKTIVSHEQGIKKTEIVAYSEKKRKTLDDFDAIFFLKQNKGLIQPLEQQNKEKNFFNLQEKENTTLQNTYNSKKLELIHRQELLDLEKTTIEAHYQRELEKIEYEKFATIQDIDRYSRNEKPGITHSPRKYTTEKMDRIRANSTRQYDQLKTFARSEIQEIYKKPTAKERRTLVEALYRRVSSNLAEIYKDETERIKDDYSKSFKTLEQSQIKITDELTHLNSNLKDSELQKKFDSYYQKIHPEKITSEAVHFAHPASKSKTYRIKNIFNHFIDDIKFKLNLGLYNHSSLRTSNNQENYAGNACQKVAPIQSEISRLVNILGQIQQNKPEHSKNIPNSTVNSIRISPEIQGNSQSLPLQMNQTRDPR